jgi:dTDP-4-amino-4,6-dideoxygalactose transaminase
MLKRVVSDRTLAVVGVHLFGVVDADLKDIKREFPEVFLIEDCAQAMGSMVAGEHVGLSGDASFFSFNKGKNVPTFGGGCIATDRDDIVKKIDEELAPDAATGLMGDAVSFAGIFALAVVTNPWIYGLAEPFIRSFRETAPPEDFQVKPYSDYKAAILSTILKNTEAFSQKRFENGMALAEGLSSCGGIALPKIAKGTRPAFNRLPVIFEDSTKRSRAEESLKKRGIESQRMYEAPLHHMFNLGYKRDEFPEARRVADGLLALPAHPLVAENDITSMIEGIKEAVS